MLPNTLLTAEQKAELQALHRIAGALLRHRDRAPLPRLGKAGLVRRELFRKMGENGYLCADVPEQYGGAGASVHFSFAVVEVLLAPGLRRLGGRAAGAQRHHSALPAALRHRGAARNTGCRAWSAAKRWRPLA